MGGADEDKSGRVHKKSAENKELVSMQIEIIALFNDRIPLLFLTFREVSLMWVSVSPVSNLHSAFRAAPVSHLLSKRITPSPKSPLGAHHAQLWSAARDSSIVLHHSA